MVRHTARTLLAQRETIVVTPGAPTLSAQPVVVTARLIEETPSELQEITRVTLGEPTPSVPLGVATEQPAAQILLALRVAINHITIRISTRPLAAGRPLRGSFVATPRSPLCSALGLSIQSGIAIIWLILGLLIFSIT